MSCTTADRRVRPTALHPNFLDAPITRWLTADPAAFSLEDYAFTEALCMAAPKLRQAAENIRAFADLMSQSDPAGLTPRLEAAATIDLGGFVAGLRQDEAAIRANIVEPWSNGLVEGQVNRAGRVPEWGGYWQPLWMRTGISFTLTTSDPNRLEASVADGDTAPVLEGQFVALRYGDEHRLHPPKPL